jgi:hypothetical protein
LSLGPKDGEAQIAVASMVDSFPGALSGTHPGRKAARSYAGRQSQDSQSPRPDDTADPRCPRRQGDRMRRREFVAVWLSRS